MRRPIWQAALVGLGFALGMSTAATADVLFPACTDSGGFDSTVNTPNTALSAFAGPYGEICITLDATGTIATVEAETFSPPNRMGGEGTLALEVNATSFTASPPTGDGGSYTVNISSTSSLPEDGFGKFDFRIDSFDGFGHSSTMLDFTLTNTSGTWASASDVLTLNSNGADAAMHIFVSGCTDPNGAPIACVTGFAAEGPGTITENPEPGVLSLFGIGLLGIGLTLARRRTT